MYPPVEERDPLKTFRMTELFARGKRKVKNCPLILANLFGFLF